MSLRDQFFLLLHQRVEATNWADTYGYFMIEFIIEKYNALSTSGVNGSIIMLLLVFTVIGFMKGAVKLVFLVCTLLGAALAAYWGSESGLDFVRQHWAGVPEISGNIMGAICGFLAFMILRKIFNFLTNPFEENSLVSRFGFGVPAAIISLAVAAGLVWFGVNYLREQGTQDEMRYWMSQHSDAPIKEYPTLAKLRNKFENSVIGKQIVSIYRLQDDQQHNLARLVVIANTSRERLDELMENPKMRELMSNPKVRDLIYNNETIKQHIIDNQPEKILENPDLLSLLEDKPLHDELGVITDDLVEEPQ